MVCTHRCFYTRDIHRQRRVNRVCIKFSWKLSICPDINRTLITQRACVHEARSDFRFSTAFHSSRIKSDQLMFLDGPDPQTARRSLHQTLYDDCVCDRIQWLACRLKSSRTTPPPATQTPATRSTASGDYRQNNRIRRNRSSHPSTVDAPAQSSHRSISSRRRSSSSRR